MAEVARQAVLDRAVLWVGHPDLLWARAGGMRVLERQLFTLERAGMKSVWIATHAPAPALLATLRVPAGLDIKWVSRDQPLTGCEPPYLGVSADHFVRVETLGFLARQRYPASVTYDDDSGLGVVQVVLFREDAARARAKQPLPAGSYHRLRAPLEAGPLVDWLMAAGVKTGDGFMAKHFDRHISLSVSRSLLDTGVTPNKMTLISTAIGLAGACLFMGGERLFWVAGSLLVWLHSVLDGCDGELARVRFQESSFGADLDFWCDNLVHLALFTCIGVGLIGRPWALELGLLADAGVIASAWTAWMHKRRRRAEGARAAQTEVVAQAAGAGLDNKLSRLENALAQRDFIYLLVLLAFLERVYEFLWAAAVGNVLFFAIMLYLRRVNNEQARQPHPAR